VHFPYYENEKPYAQEEIIIDPYPVQMGIPTKICAIIVNEASVPKTVTVEFEIADFGIGLDFTTIPAGSNPQTVTVPANSRTMVCIVWMPTLSDVGHRCIQVTISGQCCHDLKSQKNLDVREALVPGQMDTLRIPVRNPFQEVVDIRIDVFSEDCRGWDVYAEPSYLQGMSPGEIRNVVLHVTPPYWAILGSGCCIDIEAWAIRGYPYYDEILIGGVRKCDEGNFIPSHEPKWAEREIEVDPYPLEVGRFTNVCATLDNWGDRDETVTLEFLLADFGLGSPFTRISHPDNPQTVTIPARSTQKFCITFRPTHAGHVCIQIKITKLGYEPVISMLNQDVVEPLWPGDTDTVKFPVCNPLDHRATVELTLDNNCPGWNVQVTPSQIVLDSGGCTTASLSVTPQQGTTLGTECTVDVIGWADDQFIGGTRKIDKPPIPHPPSGPPYDEGEIIIRPFPPEVGVPMEICAELQNKSKQPQEVQVGFYMADFSIGLPPQLIPVPGNPTTETIPPESTIWTCIKWTPTTPGHKCFQIRISQEGYRDIISWKNLDVGEHLVAGQRDDFIFTVGNPTSETADIQIAVSSGCPEWDVWTEPQILYDVPPGGIRNVTLHVVPADNGTPLGSGCYVDVETYINGELVSGFRKVDLPPVHPPPGEPSYAEREITIKPNPPVAGQPAEICVVLQNYTNVSQTADVTLYYADFGAGTPFQEVGRIPGVVFPANTAVTKCLTWQVPPGTGHVCLQVKIEQGNYEDIVSQMNIDTVSLPVATVITPEPLTFGVGNPYTQTATVQLDVTQVGLPGGVSAEVVEGNEVTLGPGETVSRTLRIASAAAQGLAVLNGSVLPGDTHLVAVEAFINDNLIGGVQFEFVVHKIFLPIIMKNYGH
jgi:hypothetical protein